jgi:hypothetical protein
MHSHDRTMIASMGFGDSDRKNNEHDLACQYLIDDGTSSHIVNTMWTKPFDLLVNKRLNELKKQDSEQKGTRNLYEGDWPEKRNRNLERSGSKTEIREARTEVPICKGDGKYKTTIGFADVVIEFGMMAAIRGESFFVTMGYDTPDGNYSYMAKPIWMAKWNHLNELVRDDGTICIEVKISSVSIGEAIRQIKFYKSFFPATYFLATRYEISQQEANLLENELIHHLHLGEGFDKWMTERKRSEVLSTSSIRL